MASALIILTDGFEEIEAFAPIDLLRRANIQVLVAGLGKLQIKSSHGVQIVCDEIFDVTKHVNFDAIILPGGPGTANLAESSDVLQAVKNYFADGKLCCAICAAPKVFFKAQILKNRKFTCFPSVEKEISGAHYLDDVVIQDENIITSKAAGTAVDFSFVIIENLLDEDEAEAVLDKIYY
ncbi:MAG: DJ-1/PfpI family protein [Chitinivibrionia bacterium]|nr:DJ-1/PfpI family protein [Chitinivibrionia bacterium]